MKPRPVTQRDLDFWHGKLVLMKAPTGDEDKVGDLQVVMTVVDGVPKLVSPWVLDERDYQDVCPFGPITVWLQCWGGMPPVDMVILKNSVGEANEADIPESGQT